MKLKKNHSYQYDLFVIGGGSGGVRGARWAASLGAKVGICEERDYGGTCVLRGCVPKKLMVYASHFLEEREIMRSYGWNSKPPELDFRRLKQNRDSEVHRLSDLYNKILDQNNVDVFQGKGCFLDPHTIQVRDQTITSQYVLIATGGRPWTPELPGAEHTLNSDGFFELEKKPESILISGGGYIGVEMAGIMNGLGTTVHLIIRGEHVLRGFDKECALFVQEEMSKKGITIHTQTTIEKIVKTKNGLSVSLSGEKDLQVEQLLLATGRVPNTAGLELESIGIQTGPKGEILVDQRSQTNIENIFAVGDVTNRMNLTPVALEEAVLIAEDLFNQSKTTMNYENIPSAIFTQPPMATVGKSEEVLKQKNIEYKVFKSHFRPLKYTLSEHSEKCFMKLLVCAQTETVLGCHMVGKDAPEIIQGLAIALKAGAKKSHFDETIGIHPTSAEEFTTMRTASP